MAARSQQGPAGSPAHRRTSTPRSELERVAWPQLPDGLVHRLRREGTTRELAAGELLFDVGQPSYDFSLLEQGAIDIVDRSDEHVVVSIHAPNFLGELGLLMGQGTFLAARASEPSRVVVVAQDRLRELVATVPELGDVIVSAYAARRRLLIEWNEGGLTIVGHDEHPATVRLLEFASRNRIAYRFVDADDAGRAREVLDPCGLPADSARDRPVVVTGTSQALVDPSLRELAAALGLELAVDAEDVFDVLVVGTGPAGLAAGVYAASEGLSTVLVEDVAIGGQAGTSSRIENYLGFATGVSGSELAYQGQIQAIKFGAQLMVPRRATELRDGNGRFEVALDDGSQVRARAVVLACGVQYRRLTLERLEQLEGAGVYYAATELEARFCRDAPAVIVGGGNSAGQAAMFLSRSASCTYVLVRGEGLAASMSSYLTDRIDTDPNIQLRTHTEVVALHGDQRLEAVTVRDRQSGERERIPTPALFIMVGAAPNTSWLHGAVALDDKGFVLTGRDGDPFATSLPGVYAVGDVRAGSVKRVASAVGEGSVVVTGVHAHLADRHPERVA